MAIPSDYAHAVAERMSEAVLQTRVEQLALMLQWLPYHTHDSRRSHAGYPDLTLAKADRTLGRPMIIFAELKSEKGRLRPDQVTWQAELSHIAALSHGTIGYHLWRPSDWLNGTIEAVLRGER